MELHCIYLYHSEIFSNSILPEWQWVFSISLYYWYSVLIYIYIYN